MEDQNNIFFNVLQLELQINRKMQKFKPISSLSLTSKQRVNTPKNTSKQKKTGGCPQLPKTKSMRNLYCSQPLATSPSPRDVNSHPNKVASARRTMKQHRFTPINQRLTSNFFYQGKRFITEDREIVYEKQIASLQHYVNEIAVKENLWKKQQQNDKKQSSDAELKQERKKFLMGQISFTHIDEKKVFAQKKFLQKFQYLSKSVPRISRCPPDGKQDDESRLYQSLRRIDRIYHILQHMQEVGYPLKTNKYMIIYCINGRLWLKKVFLHESGERRDAFRIAVKYLVNPSVEESKTRFYEFAGRARGDELQVAQEDLDGLYQHLEHSLAQKRVMQVANVATYIEGRLKEGGKAISRSLRLTQTPQDKMKLTQDLQSIEEKFGTMCNITRISRRRYDQLNRTYDKLQSLV